MTDTTVDHFKYEVKRYDSIDNEIKMINEKIKPMQNRIKELKQTKKTLEDTICSFMESNEIAQCKLSEGSLVYKESKNVLPLTKENIRQNFIKFFSDNFTDDFKKLTPEEKAENMFKYIYDNREYKENKMLKRI